MKMGKIVPYNNMIPKIHPSVFIAEGAYIIGDVIIEEDCNIWFNAIIRGDLNYIRIGARTNVQDNSVLHVTPDVGPINIGSDVTIGHNVILHGCTIENNSLIGMGSIIMDRAIVRKNSIVAAGSVVLEGFEVPEATLVAGIPAKVKRSLSENEIDSLKESVIHYINLSKQYKRDLK